MFSLLAKQNQHRLPESVVQFYIAEIACALAYLHSKDIVYRDLKVRGCERCDERGVQHYKLSNDTPADKPWQRHSRRYRKSARHPVAAGVGRSLCAASVVDAR